MATPTRPYVPSHVVTDNYAAGMLAMQDGRLSDATTYLSNEPVDSPCHALAHGNLAMVQLRLGRFESAEATARETLAEIHFTGCPHPPSWVQFVRTLGESLASQERYEESFEAFNRAGNLADELAADEVDFAREIELEKAHAFNSWGWVRLQFGDPNVAVEILLLARRIYAKYSDTNRVGRAETQTNYGLALWQAGRLTSADLNLREALSEAQADQNADQVC